MRNYKNVQKKNIDLGSLTNYIRYLKRKTEYIDFKGIDIFAKNAKSIKTSILTLYADLHIKNFQGISDDKTTLEEIVDKERGIIIQGPPGSGKSTFVKYIVRRKLDDSDKFLAFIIDLENFGSFISDKDIIDKMKAKQVLLDYLAQEYLLFPLGILEEIIGNQSVWFLFDGFDEISGYNEKIKISNMINSLFDIWGECKFIITTRPYAITDLHFQNDFQIVNIDLLHIEEIESYIDSLANITNTDQYKIDKYGLINKIGKGSDIFELAQVPVMLTFICIIYFAQGDFPKNRSDILKSIIDWLIKSKNKSKKQQDEKFQLYANIAYKILNSKYKKDIGKNLLLEIAGVSGDKALDLLTQLNDVGIVVEKKNSRYRFWHFCFQEFFAACYLYGEVEANSNKLSIVLDHWFEPEWQDVIIIFFFQLFKNDFDLMIDCINKASKFLSEFDIHKMIKGASLLGKIFREVYPEQSFFNYTNEWDMLKQRIRVLFDNTIDCVDIRDKFDAAIAYGLSGDERIRNFDETFTSINGGTCTIGAQNIDKLSANYDSKATEFEQPVRRVIFQPFEFRKFPITVEEYEDFINSGGYKASKEIWTSGGYKWRTENVIELPRNWFSQVHLRNSPVTGISWYEAVAYCNWLTNGSMDRNVYKLPSEACWEYTFRTCFHKNYSEYYPINCSPYVDLREKSPIGMFPSSSSEGIADMMGNVEEWCEDSWSISLSNCPEDGSAWIDNNEKGAVTRGGSTIRTPRLCRPTYRSKCDKHSRYDTIGFRVIRHKQ